MVQRGRITAVCLISMEKKISALRLQKNHSQRVNVFLDGEFAFGLSRIVAGWLKPGQMLDDEMITTLLAEDAREKAYQLSLNYLRYRDRSAKEIQDYLLKHLTDPQIIENTIERLKENNLINDAKFSETWVENRSVFRPRSKRALAFELHKHGISQEHIDQALQNVNEEELIYSLGKKRAERFTNMEWPEFRRKMFSYLSSRGFSYDQVQPIVVQFWKENQKGMKISTTSEEMK